MAWRVICDRCGFEKWNNELRKEWTGLMVCRSTCWEARHPQDTIRGRPDRQNPPWVRPEPADVFLDPYAGNPVLFGLLADGVHYRLEATLDDGSIVFLEGTE